jgi:hypothetical protein
MLKSVRDGKKVPFECPDCGCRLNVFSYDPETVVAHHYTKESNRDAKGHSCKSIGRVWTLPIQSAIHLL